ncbi:MAG TPA: 2-amino-4-hydroxy-6-hydroxymethyldihydropteridine diphosphokinase [Vicinamibacterales bacterium]|nr:2-amino-4-hydroxy-6-hydroxymethyldihydropteridine diphosphokinase [Vicinamibacterales bacterium]
MSAIPQPVPVAIALGSNLGDRHGHLRWAIETLATRLANFRASHAIETEPYDVPTRQPPYLNAAVIGETTMGAGELLAWLLSLEHVRGRSRTSPRAPRTLDLDLILYGDFILSEPGVSIPHPRFRERAFVVDPLAEIAPDWVDPLTGRTIEQIATALRA